MKIIYEKETEGIIDGEVTKEFKTVVDKKEATHEHICYHDEGKGKPCRRVKL